MRKTVLITGGAKGIGRAISNLFAENGYNVVINYFSSRDEAISLENELTSKGYSAISLCTDVTNKTQMEEMINHVYSRFGKIDVLVNNAGISDYKLFIDTTEDDWDKMMNVHLKGLYNSCYLITPKMISGKSGKIINISSIWGMVGASCEVAYSTAKAGIIGFTKALAKELGPSNIQVNCITPGVIETDMIGNLTDEDKDALIEETPLLRIGKPMDVASLVLYLSKDEASFITGQVISPNGGLVI